MAQETFKIKLGTLGIPFIEGGANVPNFQTDYCASQVGLMWIWLHLKDNQCSLISNEKTRNAILQKQTVKNNYQHFRFLAGGLFHS